MATTNHAAKQALAERHQPAGGADEKGCLTRHQRREDNHQCSHQWQAYERAKADSGVYNYPAYKDLCGEGTFATGARTAASGRSFPPRYALENNFPFKKKPRPGQWDIGIKRNLLHYTKPYWNNAHHIIPNGTLAGAIAESSKDDPRVELLIKLGLLRRKYNLNDKVNMIILPMDKAVAEALRLPRHLKGHEAGPDQTPQYMSHPDYSRRVKLMVRPVTNQYAQLVRNSPAYQEKHPPPPDELAREQLERISETLYEAIKTAGRFLGGKSLDEFRFGGVGGR